MTGAGGDRVQGRVEVGKACVPSEIGDAGSTGGSLAGTTNWRRLLRKWVVRLSFAIMPRPLRQRLWRRQTLAGAS